MKHKTNEDNQSKNKKLIGYTGYKHMDLKNAINDVNHLCIQYLLLYMKSHRNLNSLIIYLISQSLTNVFFQIKNFCKKITS